MRLPLAFAVMLVGTLGPPIVDLQTAAAEEGKILDCYAEVMGSRVIDGPCRVTRNPTPGYGNMFDTQMLTFDKRGNLYFFVNVRTTDFSTTLSWNGTPGEEKDMRALGNTLRKPYSNPDLPEKCRANEAAEICIWDKNDRPSSMMNSNKIFALDDKAMDWDSFIPPFNVDINCKNISANDQSLKECINNEQSSYNDLKAAWKTIDSDIKSECAHYANMKPWENYQEMVGCINRKFDEIEAKQPPPTFQR